MGHEGPGSILSALKVLGWSNNLVAGSRPAPRGMGFFGVTVDLTEEGMKHIDDIVELVFQYLTMLKTQGPQKWVQDENRDIGNMLFRFKDKESPRNYISGLVHTLQVIFVSKLFFSIKYIFLLGLQHGRCFKLYVLIF